MEQYGGLFQTPAYLLRLKPQLLLDGEIVAEGAPCPAGSQQKYTISIHSAAPDRQDSETGNSIVAGGMYCIVSDYGTMSADKLQESADRMEALQETVSEVSVYTDEVMGNLLDSIGKAYFARLDLYNTVISGQDNVSAARDFSVGMVGFNINVISSFGRPTELNEGGIFLDIGHNVHSVVSNENDEDAEKAYMLQAGIYASAMEHGILEHGILEQSTGVESVSTIKIFGAAQENNIPMHTITKENLSGEMSALAVSDQVKKVKSGWSN